MGFNNGINRDISCEFLAYVVVVATKFVLPQVNCLHEAVGIAISILNLIEKSSD